MIPRSKKPTGYIVKSTLITGISRQIAEILLSGDIGIFSRDGAKTLNTRWIIQYLG